jgi:hypothetical protein
MTEENKEWEKYGDGVKRMKVEGGYIYKHHWYHDFSICFVPDVDLERYQSHLRDAYNQGFKDGQDSNSFYSKKTAEELPKGLPGQIFNMAKNIWEYPENTL